MSNLFIEIPKQVQQLLKQIQTVTPEAILAGGYLRDLDHKVQPKDIDIFVSAIHSLFELQRLCDVADWRYNEVTESAECDDTISNQIHWTVEGIEQEVNVLACARDIIPVERFSRFDFGLCQIMFDGAVLITTPAYQLDKINKTFTLMRYTNSKAHENSIQRFVRFKWRYPEHKLIIPDEFQKKYEAELEAITDVLEF